MRNLLGKNVYKIHQWSGLVAGIFIFIMGLSGAVLVFHEDLEVLEHRSHWRVENQAPVSIDKAYQTITRQYPHWEIRLQRFSTDPAETLIFSLRRPEERLMVFAHPANGSLLAVLDPYQTFTNWVLRLHYAFHAGLAGEILVFIIGLTFLVSLVTGVITYRKAIGRMLLFRTGFKRKNRRALASSLHRFVGVWALVLNLLMVLSGLVISYSIVANGLKTVGAAPAQIASPPLGFSIDGALQTLRRQYPGFEPTYMRFPKTADQPLSVNGRMAGQAFYYSQYYNAATFDRTTGQFLEMKLNPDAPAGSKLDSIVRGVHFVEYGNWWVKALFCFVGLSAPLLSVTGFLLWRWKTKKSKAAAVREVLRFT
jgi:uncharacterized iron-regulated membrane protein